MSASENQAQKDYAGFVASTTASIEADREAIAETEKQLATAKSESSETEGSQAANQASLDKLADLLSNIHGQCDFVLKYFDIRQSHVPMRWMELKKPRLFSLVLTSLR